MTAWLTKFVKYAWCREWLLDSPNECAEKIVMSRRTLVPTVTQMSKKWWATRLTGQPCFLTAVTTHRSTTISNHCTKLSRQTCLASISSNSLNTAKINIATVYKTLRWGHEVLISFENVAKHWTNFGILSLNPAYGTDICMYFRIYKSLNALPEPSSPKCGRSPMKCVMHKNSKCQVFLIHAMKAYRGSIGIAPLIHN